MDKPVFLITGGLIKDLAWLQSRIDEKSPAAIICADSGARHIHALGLMPQLIIGDMDSLAPQLLRAFSEKGVKICRYPAAKDETDTELAFDAAMAFHPAEIWVLGALGHRLDHTLANLSLLLKGEACKVPVKLVDEWCEISLITGTGTIEGEVGQTVSLLPFFGEATGVTLSGFEYSLDGRTMSMITPFGVSNRLMSAKATVSIASGRLLVIRYFQPGVFPE